MGWDYQIIFADTVWYANNRSRVLGYARALPHAVPTRAVGSATAESEIWLKEIQPGKSTGWAYDVRLFVRDRLVVEVSTRGTRAYLQDVHELMSWLGSQTVATLVGDDGEPVDGLSILLAKKEPSQ